MFPPTDTKLLCIDPFLMLLACIAKLNKAAPLNAFFIFLVIGIDYTSGHRHSLVQEELHPS